MINTESFKYQEGLKMGMIHQTQYPAWEDEIDRRILTFIVNQYDRLDHAKGGYQAIWQELETLLGQINLDGHPPPQEERQAYIHERVAFYRDREFPYFQGDAERQFIISQKRLPEGHEWERFRKQYATEHPLQNPNYAHLFQKSAHI